MGPLTSTPTVGQGRPRSNGNEEVLHIPQGPELELHHKVQMSVIPRTPLYSVWGRCLSPAEKAVKN